MKAEITNIVFTKNRPLQLDGYSADFTVDALEKFNQGYRIDIDHKKKLISTHG